MKKIIDTHKAPKAVGTYSQGVFLNGNYFFSGQIGLDPATGDLANGFDAQLERILKNIDGLLDAENLTRKHILKTTIFMTDLKEFAKVNKAYELYFEAPYPARSTVQVTALPKGALIEIEVIAGKNV